MFLHAVSPFHSSLFSNRRYFQRIQQVAFAYFLLVEELVQVKRQNQLSEELNAEFEQTISLAHEEVRNISSLFLQIVFFFLLFIVAVSIDISYF